MRKLARCSRLARARALRSVSRRAADKERRRAGGKGGGKVKVYDFSGDTIEGDLVKPEGSTVDARDFAKHSSPDQHPQGLHPRDHQVGRGPVVRARVSRRALQSPALL